jgi:hypothetical protein
VDRRDQIAHLVDVGSRPGVRLHLQRFADGPPQGMFSPLNIFDLPDGEPSLAFTETDYAIQEVVNAEQVSTYIAAFDRAVDAALEPGQTASYLRQLADQLE